MGDLSALAAAGSDPNSLATLLAVYALQGMGGGGDPDAKRRKFKRGSPAEAKPGDWTCAYCETLNYCKDKTCHKCEAVNVNGTRVSMRAGDWVCQNCGDLVFSNNVNCRQCKTRRTPDSLKQGERICAKCDYIVFWYKKECSRCNTPKPGNAKVNVYDALKKASSE